MADKGDVIPPLPGDVSNCICCAEGHGGETSPEHKSFEHTHTHISMNPVSTSISKLFRIFHAQTSCLSQDANTNADAQTVW